jgi:hypothetical protein
VGCRLIFTPSDKYLISLCLPELGKHVSRVEAGRPLSAWTKEEILVLVEVTVGAYFDAQKETLNDDIPF